MVAKVVVQGNKHKKCRNPELKPVENNSLDHAVKMCRKVGCRPILLCELSAVDAPFSAIPDRHGQSGIIGNECPLCGMILVRS